MMNQSETSRGIWEWDIVKLILGLSVILFVLIYSVGGFTEESTRLVIRWSARISVTSFCLAFGGSAIHHFTKNSLSWWLMMNRKYWGISFAIVHLIHLCFLGVLQYFFHPVFTLAASTSLLAGGLAYLFVILMFMTSFETFSNKISRQNWKILHNLGGYWIWIIFANSYWKNVLINGVYTYLPFALLLVFILILRLAKLATKDKKNH